MRGLVVLALLAAAAHPGQAGVSLREAMAKRNGGSFVSINFNARPSRRRSGPNPQESFGDFGRQVPALDAYDEPAFGDYGPDAGAEPGLDAGPGFADFDAGADEPGPDGPDYGGPDYGGPDYGGPDGGADSRFGGAEPDYGADYGGPGDEFGGPGADFGGPGADFGGPGADFGGPGDDFGGPGNDFGGPGNDFGGPADDFGGPGADFGGPADDFGGPGLDFGGPGLDFGGPDADFGGPSDFGRPSAGFGGPGFGRQGFEGLGFGGLGFGSNPFGFLNPRHTGEALEDLEEAAEDALEHFSNFGPRALIQCNGGLVRNTDGRCVEPRVLERVYLYDVPVREPKVIPAATRVSPPVVHKNVVFVRLPNHQFTVPPLVVEPPREKSVVYVLNKQAKIHQPVVQVPTPPRQEPDVFFVNYGEGENPVLPGGGTLRSLLRNAIPGGGRTIGDEGLNPSAMRAAIRYRAKLLRGFNSDEDEE